LISVALRHKDDDALKLLHFCLLHDTDIQRPVCDS